MYDLFEIPFKLSNEQIKPVNSSSRYIKILAGAGAGKTEVLTRRIVNLLLNMDASPESIVAFTFTDKAAKEMKNRVLKRIQEIAPEYNTSNLLNMYIGTIHSFCFRLLQDHFDYGMYKTVDQNQEMAYILRNGYTYGLKQVEGSTYSDKCITFQKSLDIYYGEAIQRDEINKLNPNFIKILDRYENSMNKNKIISFSQLIYFAVNKIKDNKEKISNIKYLLVDEYQDINRVQYDLIKLIGENASIFAVGDPRQSIYEWRGSNYKYFEEFSTDFSDAEEFTLNENRRSTKSIVNISNTIVKQFPDNPGYPDMVPVREKLGDVIATEYENASKEAEGIANKIKCEIKKGKKYSKFAVLFRSVNTSGDLIIDEFKKQKIPYLVAGNAGLFKRGEVLALAQVFCWFADDGFWHVNGDKLTDDKLLEKAIENWEITVNKLPNNIKEQLNYIKSSLNSYADYRVLYQDVLKRFDYSKLDQGNDLDNAILANIGRFTKVLGDYEQSVRYGGGNKNIQKEMKDLCWFINTYANHSYQEAKIEDLSKDNVVTVSTIHQSKGLEWETVFLPSIINRRFPSLTHFKSNLMIDQSLYDYSRYETSLDSEYRLFYVAVTRAKNYCLMSSFAVYPTGKKTSESKFMSIIDKYEQIENIEIDSEDNSNSTDVFSIPVTSLIDYKRCPYHYKLSKEWGYTQGVSPFMGYGEALHYILQCLSEAMINNKQIDEHYIENVVNTKFFLPFASTQFLDNQKKDINKKIKLIFDTYLKNNKISEVESRIEFPLENAIIDGKIDVIIDKHGNAEIRDYKTSEDVVTKEEADMQILLYAEGLRSQGYHVTKVSTISIKTNEKNEQEIDDNIISENKKRTEGLINSLKNGEFKGKKSKFCERCEYLEICKYQTN